MRNSSGTAFEFTGARSRADDEVQVSVPGNMIQDFSYDSATGQLTSQEHSVTGEVQFSYDTYGRISGRLMPSGVQETMTYDAMGRLDVVTLGLPGGNQVRDYNWNGFGRLTSETVGGVATDRAG